LRAAAFSAKTLKKVVQLVQIGANLLHPTENQKLPAKGPRPSAGSKIHFKL
jgi:hypothetical protein